MNGRRLRVPSPRRAWQALIVGLAAASAALGPGACTYSAGLASDTPGFTAVPAQLATSLPTPGGTWATVPMGHLDDPSNTFWQLLFQPAGTTTWTDQVEPTATATNGGLVLATAPGQPLLVGVLPSYDLAFTPIIATADEGVSWSTGLLDAPVVAQPNALAVGPAGHALGIADVKGAAQVLESSGGLSSWHTLVTEDALGGRAPGRLCAPTAITAVGYVGAAPLVGTSCRRPGVVGLFVEHSGTWDLAGPHLPAALAHRDVQVLGLDHSAGGTVVVIAASGARGTDLLASWTTDGDTWRSAPALALARGQHAVSYGPTGGGGLFALLEAPGGAQQLELLPGPSSAWQPLPPPPAGTATVAYGANGTADALVVDDTVLTVWALAPGTDHWTRSQVLHVPIAFGSSNP